MAPLQQTHLMQPQTVHEFILEKELPGLEEAVQRGEDSMARNERLRFPRMNSHGKAPEECTCPHLLSIFPDHLHVQLVPSSPGISSDPSSSTQVYRIQDPLAALHLRSQLEEDGTIVLPPPNGALAAPPLWLYGDEEERRHRIRQPGMPEYYHAHILVEAEGARPHTDAVVPSGVTPPAVGAAKEDRKAVSSEDPSGATAHAPQFPVPPHEASSAPLPNEGAAAGPPPAEGATTLPVTSSVPTMEMTAPAPDASQVTEEVVKEESIAPSVEPVSSSDVPREGATFDAVTPLETTDVATTKRPQEALEEPTPTEMAVEYWLPEATFLHYQKMEEQILQIRQNGLSKRSKKKHVTPGPPHMPPPPPLLSVTSMTHRPKLPPPEETVRRDYFERQQHVVALSERLLEQYRRRRRHYWSRCKEAPHRPNPLDPHAVPFGSFGGRESDDAAAAVARREEQEWMQCLECAHTGAPEPSRYHFLSVNHRYAVTCDARARIYCFSCCDFVHHEVFANEKHRIDVMESLPWMAWPEHVIHRSFDALQFVHIPDVGITWKGMKATYPILVAKDHFRATQLCRERYILFHGEVDQLPSPASPAAVEFTTQQRAADLADRNRIPAPVGLYNLGNTCFMSAILHCLIHCLPLQQYFLRDVGHHHLSCNLYRAMNAKPAPPSARDTSSAKAKAKLKTVCLACEMDKLFLRYLGSARGMDLLSLVDESPSNNTNTTPSDAESSSRKKDSAVIRGSPLLTAEMLAASWKCGGMNHLAGYEQRDAHEFLHGFLETLGKHMRQYRDRVRATINAIQTSKPFLSADDMTSNDEIKNLFEGTLRSVLVCGDCGSKRIQSESFMSISLPLSAEAAVTSGDDRGGSLPNNRPKLTVESCLRHFTMPEMLTDPVFCPTCSGKTPTKKQHVVSKLPKVLCLHLKRFDAAHNKKIEEYVSFPTRGLNMGPFLPHWCEVSMLSPNYDHQENIEKPNIFYDLFGTVNHFGNLQSGHYVTNLKVKEQWYHCNDSFVGFASEEEILRSEGAYLLFYIRR